MILVHSTVCDRAYQNRLMSFGSHDRVCICRPHRATPPDNVNHPAHYTKHPSGVECIDVVEHMSFNLGNAVKYIWRAGLKSEDPKQDLQKAAWYIKRELERLDHGKDDQAKEHGPADASAAPGDREDPRNVIGRVNSSG